MMVLFISMIRFSNRYDTIVTNITRANDYNLSFKESIDYTMYRIVIGSADFDSFDEEEGIRDPYALIENAEGTFINLRAIASTDKSEKRISNVIKHLNTLEERIDEIKENVEKPLEIGTYEENIFKLETNIYILTELIQEQIQEYIYYESSSMETVRQKINTEINTTSKPLHELSETTKLVAEGDFKTRASLSTGDEVTTLTYNFNKMIEQIEGLINDVKEEQKNLRETELKLLQAQINPHFLYNTLDNIIWLIEANKKENAMKMVSLLSEFFRTSLNKGKDIITIEQEEAHVRSYLRIQQYRYQDILEYIISIDSAIKHENILKLTLQPLIENAIYHGIKNKRGKGMINVSGKRDGDLVVLVIEDNGRGIEEERLIYLRNLLVHSPKMSEIDGFGILNVNERIKLKYGRKYGIHIESRYGEGTKVTVSFPIKGIE
jgi:two-component system sensor histidine kinase YesM